jgi:hypothetical protein
MFVRDFVHVDRPFSELAPRFLHGHQWLESTMVGAVHQVLAARAEDATGADRAVTCECGPAREQSDTVVVPIRSVVLGGLPHLDGDLRISPFGSTRSHIALSGVWGTAGVDPVETQHVLDIMARTFLQRVVSQLDSGEDRSSGEETGR